MKLSKGYIAKSKLAAVAGMFLLIVTLVYFSTVGTAAEEMEISAMFAADAFNAEAFSFEGRGGEVFMENQWRSLHAFNDFMDNLAVNRRGEPEYPAFFGGVFLDNDGNLVVNVVESGARSAAASQEMGGMLDMEGTRVQIVQFSYAELNAMMYWLADDHLSNPDCDVRYNVTHFVLDTVQNRIVVGLYNYNAYSIAKFEYYVTGSPMFMFVESPLRMSLLLNVNKAYDTIESTLYDPQEYYDEMSERSTIHVSPGARIYLTSGNSYAQGSVGYGIVRRANNARGFLMTPHGDTSFIGWTARLGSRTGPILGTLISPIVFRDGIDAGVIALNNDAFFMNSTDGFTLVRGFENPPVGAIVDMISAMSGRQRGRTVANNNFYCPAARMGRLVLVNANNRRGDSGGLVYMSIDPWRAQALGIIVSGTPQQATFSRQDLINSALSIDLN